MISKDVYAKLAEELNLPEDVVEKVSRAEFLFIRTVIEALPLKEELSEEEFNNLKTSFNLPSLGKLYCTYDKYANLKKRYEYIKKIRNAKGD